jgi:hypothetical protein
VIAAVVALAVPVLSAVPVAAGGSVWEFDREAYAPGEVAFAWAPVAWEHSTSLGTPDDGAFFAWLHPSTSPDAASPPGRADPASLPKAVRVGRLAISLDPYEIAGMRLGPHHATVTFDVPDVPPGDYELLHCNAPCTTTLGDITWGTITIVRRDPDECATRVTAVPRSDVPDDVDAWADGHRVIGAGALWTTRAALRGPHVLVDDGTYSLKFPWYLRPADGEVPRITASRVDGEGDFEVNAQPAFSDGTSWVASGLSFSTSGCWIVTGEHRGSVLRFALQIRDLVPCPGTIQVGATTSPDALPAASSGTDDFAHVDEVLRASAARIRRDYRNVSWIGIGPGGGRVWDRAEDGSVSVHEVTDFAIRVGLDRVADCPSGGALHVSYDGVPLYFGVLRP